MARTYEVTLYAYTLMANHVHLLLQVRRRRPRKRVGIDPNQSHAREARLDQLRAEGYLVP